MPKTWDGSAWVDDPPPPPPTVEWGDITGTVADQTDLGDAATRDVGTTAGTVTAGDDARLSDARTPTAHASSHADGGADEIAVHASQVTGGTLAVARGGTGLTTSDLTGQAAKVVTVNPGETGYELSAPSGGQSIAVPIGPETRFGSTIAHSPLAPYIFTGGATATVAAGYQVMCRSVGSGQTIASLSIVTSASSLTAGQGVHVAVYNESVDGGPGTVAWSQLVTVGTTVGIITVTGLSPVMPSGPVWIALLNPSGNAGSVALRAAPVGLGASAVLLQNGSPTPVIRIDGQAGPPGDMTAKQWRESHGGPGLHLVPEAGANFPLIGARI